MAYPCLYTRQLTKKHPSWVDGFVSQLTGSRLRLFDENRKVLSEGVCDTSSSTDEPVSLNEYLVQLLEPLEHSVTMTSAGDVHGIAKAPILTAQPFATTVYNVAGGSAVLPKKRRLAGITRRTHSDNGFQISRPLILASTAETETRVEPYQLPRPGAAPLPRSTLAPASCTPMVQRPLHAERHSSLFANPARMEDPTRDVTEPPSEHATRTDRPLAATHRGDMAERPTESPIYRGQVESSNEDWWLFGAQHQAAASPLETVQPQQLLPLPRSFTATANIQCDPDTALTPHHWQQGHPRSLLLQHHVASASGPSGESPHRDDAPPTSPLQATSAPPARPRPSGSHVTHPNSKCHTEGARLGGSTIHFLRRPGPQPQPAVSSASGLIIPGPSVCLPALAVLARSHCARCTSSRAPMSEGAPLSSIQIVGTCPQCFWNRVPLSVVYTSTAAYTFAQLRAMSQEANMLLAAAFSKYWRVLADNGGRGSTLPSSSISVGHDLDMAQFQRRCRDAHVPFYGTCELILQFKKLAKQPAIVCSENVDDDDDLDVDGASAVQSRKKKRAHAKSAAVRITKGDNVGSESSARIFLRFPKVDREKTTGAYSRDDLWVISTSPQFGHALPPEWSSSHLQVDPPRCRSGRDADFFAPSSANAPLVWLGRAVYHGPSSSDMIELTPVAPSLSAGRVGNRGLDYELLQNLSSPPSRTAFGSARSIRVCALHGPNLSSEVAALDVLASLAVQPAQAFPLLQFLASPGPPPTCETAVDSAAHAESLQIVPRYSSTRQLVLHVTFSERDAIVEGVSTEFHLNGEQTSVLRACASALRCTQELHSLSIPAAPTILCHGVFGAGKSQTLVALCVMFSKLLDLSESRDESRCLGPPDTTAGEVQDVPTAYVPGGVIDLSTDEDEDDVESATPGGRPTDVAVPSSVVGSAKTALVVPKCRIIVAAATNAAVDRVLLGLKASGYAGFTRIGAVRKCAKAVLPHLLPYDDDADARKKTINELRMLLQDPGCGGQDKDAAAEALSKLELNDDHVHHLGVQRIFGSTCAATAFPCMRDRRFEICILDEASQMLEPASLLPLRFGGQLLVCAGDPMQLPPIVARAPVDVECPSAATDLSQLSLFVRLAQAGVPKFMLRTQYRCHPVLSQLCSQLFYDGAVRDGVTAGQRGPRIRGLAPLVVYDYSGIAQPAAPWSSSMSEQLHAASGSLFNAFEASIAARLVSALLARGQDPASLGVICLYRAQVWEVQRKLSSEAQGVQVATVVSRVVCDVLSAAHTLDVFRRSQDAFQGSERSIVILCCSRTSSATPSTSSSANNSRFIDDSARLNVAFSRAQHHLLICCHARCLSVSPLWSHVLSRAQALPGGLRSCHAAWAEDPRNDCLLAPPAPCVGTGAATTQH